LIIFTLPKSYTTFAGKFMPYHLSLSKSTVTTDSVWLSCHYYTLYKGLWPQQQLRIFQMSITIPKFKMTNMEIQC